MISSLLILYELKTLKISHRATKHRTHFLRASREKESYDSNQIKPILQNFGSIFYQRRTTAISQWRKCWRFSIYVGMAKAVGLMTNHFISTCGVLLSHGMLRKSIISYWISESRSDIDIQSKHIHTWHYMKVSKNMVFVFKATRGVNEPLQGQIPSGHSVGTKERGHSVGACLRRAPPALRDNIIIM